MEWLEAESVDDLKKFGNLKNVRAVAEPKST